MKAKTLFDEALSAYQLKNYLQARLCFGQCLTEKTIPPAQHQAAAFMLSHLLIEERKFQQALAYIMLLGNDVVQEELLPSLLRKQTLQTLLQNALTSPLIKIESSEFDLRGFALKSEAVNTVLDALKKHPQITLIRLGDNCLDEKEVNALLDVLLEHEFLLELDLTGLPINREAALRLNQLIAKMAQREGRPDEEVCITLSQYPMEADITRLIRLLKRTKHAKIRVEITQDKQQTLLVSGAIHAVNSFRDEKLAFLPEVEAIRRCEEPEGRRSNPDDDGKAPNKMDCFVALRASRNDDVVEPGTLIAHTALLTQGLFVLVHDNMTFNMNHLAHLVPLPSVYIHAPHATVEFDGPLVSRGVIHIECQNCHIKDTAQITSKGFQVRSQNKVYVAGNIKADHFAANAALLIMTKCKPLITPPCN